jgi:hypothetical protein
MSDKKFLSWVGYKGEEEEGSVMTSNSDAPRSVERIRELESQLAELRSRRDITSLSKEEFEILATETAMSLIKTAQQRETKSIANAERILSESKKSATAALENAAAKAKSTLAAAESRGKKYIEAAEADAAQIISQAERESEELLATRKREASAIVSASKREAERLIQSATSAINEFKVWLSQVVAESERLYRIQTQALDAAESSISQSRQRLDSAFSKLSKLQASVSGSAPKPSLESSNENQDDSQEKANLVKSKSSGKAISRAKK